ncbi:hypothetical protein DMB65_07970 [Flavobacterium cheongpyeongense]|uniref:Uncharacterized protein n=1 Tax=Flavobacterium cheongpyeongense TaxID=2212651 RepID=A0A2V4BUB3_9FLAO|nr:hypothetical protein [Flavobacterium cheongpyeongense]PXY41330.1 hypothetical protein DMB65_07970 [Flavobacterium cheongpyeongense]
MKNFEKTISQEVADFAKDNPGKYKLITDKIRSYHYNDYTNDYYSFAPFKNQLLDIYINHALQDYRISRSKNLRNEIIEIADYKLDRRYDVIIALDDEEAFQKVLGYATDFLKGDSFLFDQKLYVNSQSLFALVKAYYNPKYKNTVLSFFNTAFEYAKVYAKEKIEFGRKADTDPDAETLLELVQAISSFKDEDREQFASLIFEIYTFSSQKKRGYAMYQASGFMAIQLTYFQASFNIKVIIDAIEITGKYYADNIFVKQTLYAKWFLEKNTKEAFLYFQSNTNPMFAVFVLTDLGFKDALPLFIEKQKEEENPVMWEIYEEAIQRLKNDFLPKNQTERMSWLNGNLTPTQRALGAENDNVFVQRAQQKTFIDDNVYETDND